MSEFFLSANGYVYLVSEEYFTICVNGFFYLLFLRGLPFQGFLKERYPCLTLSFVYNFLG